MVEGGANSLLPNTNLYSIIEGRAGNRAAGGDYELSIQNNTGSTSSTGFQGHNAWASGQVYNFIVSFNPSTQLVTWNFNNGATVLSRTLNYTPARQVTDIFLRTTATTVGTAITVNVNSITQNSVATNFANAQSKAERITDSEVEYLWITGLNPNAAWSLTGNVQMSWTASAPNSSGLAFQMKLGDANVQVPEPATWTMLLSAFGLFGIGAYRRSRA